MTTNSQTSRRQFLGGMAAGSAGLLLSSGNRVSACQSPGERPVFATIGLRNQGWAITRKTTKFASFAALADVDANVLEANVKKVQSRQDKKPDSYKDYRKVLDRKDIDAVMIATPDHWHTKIAVEAMLAGKDVYCEKPVTHLFAESQAIYREVEKQGAIFQTGSQQRSQTRFRVAAETVLNGHIGKVQSVEVGLPTGFTQPRTEQFEVSEPPAGLDYDLWCGPSEKLPYIFARHHRHWRWHYAYGGGQIMDWIGHHNDIAHWSLGMDESGPEEVEAVNWTFPETKIYNTPVNYEIRCKYVGGITTSISDRHASGIKWIGENGWLYVDRSQFDASNREWIRESFDRGPIKPYHSTNHYRNFLDGIRSRKTCIAPAETAHRSITPGHLGLVSQILGKPLKWDPKAEVIIGDPDANKLLKEVHYRKPWKLI